MTKRGFQLPIRKNGDDGKATRIRHSTKGVVMGNADERLDKALLALSGEISTRDERQVTFFNGCSLSLLADDGVYWGTTPYGLDWCCDAGLRLGESLCRWIAYWNTPRTESGEPIAAASPSKRKGRS
jgi:hypothetical protein